jgi:hypothetical protein
MKRVESYVCHDALDFIQAAGFPGAICFFTLAHSRRKVVQH